MDLVRHFIARQTTQGSLVPGTNLTVEQYCDQVRDSEPKLYDLPGYDPTHDLCNPYRYMPSKAWGFASVILFGIATLAHLFLTIRTRRWWLLNWVVGGALETLGWVGRLIGGYDPYSQTAFIIQVVCLIIAPAFFSAAIYGILGWVISATSPKYSIIRPNRYWIIFITGDIVSLVVQAIGGGVASAGSNSNDVKKLHRGSDIMLGGIIVQLAVMIIFSVFALHFWNGLRKSPLAPHIRATPGLERLHWLGWGLVFGSTMIILRGIYRVIELAEGWRGYLMLHEFWFLFDMLPCLICLLIFIPASPLFALPRGYQTAEDLARRSDVSHVPDGEKTTSSDDETRVGVERGDQKAWKERE
ncbi:RTA1-domain-containing protein [Atractiella rhizophila]|nr:RTA1-domain-containing protein [Atractiella rhizophila]